jgi:cbb3-type cytochrome oxidase subunit 3
MNIDTVRALLTLTLFVAFVLLWVWAWKKGRHADFHDAAQLALENDEHTIQRSEGT